jgi:peptidoglycan/xylan/chitin deacetylase (PgdA/CDA1 family)
MVQQFIRLFLVIILLTVFISPVYETASAAKMDSTIDPGHTFQTLMSGQRFPQGEQIHYIPPEQPTVYLTFDDGPSHLTPIVLDILKDEGIQASFFAMGLLAEKRPETIGRIVDEGHSLGNHTYDHEYKQLYGHFNEFWKQIQRTEDILYRITGDRPALVRAPGGTSTNFDAFYFYYLERSGYQVHDWNIDSGDSKRRGVPAEEIIENVKKGPFPYEINLLLHDSAGHEESVKALPEIIRFFKNKGYSFAPLTKDVKPVQFSVKQNKWQRTMKRADHESILLKTSEQLIFNSEREIMSVDQAQSIATESAAVLRQIKEPKLSLYLGSRHILFNSNDYSLDNGTLYVPIRTLIEQMGGSAEWNEKQRKAVIRYGMQKIEYHMDTQKMIVYAPSQNPRTIYQADFSVKNGSIIVPLRSTLELFDNQVIQYTAHEIKREVRVI